MADFIAVIRRAVDGLTDNTPDMRVKVYERARGAVQRQLENMKPRPPEAMLQRQLEKLEAAIREVEAEHADALPAEDQVAVAEPVTEAPAEPEVAPEPEVAAAPEPVAEQAEEAPAAEPAYEHPAYEPPAHEEPVYEEPAYEAPVEPEAPVADEPVAHEEPVYEEPAPVHAADVHEEPEVQPEPEVYHEPAHSHDEPVFEEAPHVSAAEPETVEPWQLPVEDQYDAARETHGHDFAAAPDVEPYAEPVIDDAPRAQPVARDFDLSNRLVEPVPVFEPPHQFVEQTQDDPIHADAAGHFDPVWNEPAEEVPEPSTKTVEPTDWALEELRQFSETSHAAPAANDAARAFDEVVSSIDYASAPVPAAPAKMPAANESFSWEAAAFDDLPPIDNDKKTPAATSYEDVDLFSEIHGGPTPKNEPLAGDDWQEATRLRGYDNRGVVAEDDDGLSVGNSDDDIASKFQGKNFRMEPKRRRFGIGSIIALLIALGVVGGGGYAAYTHQAALTEMVKGLVSAAPSQTAQTPPPVAGTTAPADQTSDAKPAAATPDAAQNGAAPADGSAAGNKFTQRLMADGTEVDSGPAAAPSTQVAEGKSVAEQNVASADPVAPAAAGTTPPAAASGTAAPDAAASATPPAAGQTAPAGSSEKMFLYEERIGQSSPTAIQGSIVWSLHHEAGADGKQEASVQGTLTVPERNLTAQINFKRNSDPSLPASHIVEMVFSLPANFEGGAIDSVQRISMKRTEQDRGDALVAVPAKITDDFHMIALNDYPDARKANLDLLSTRDWIDIPITYRNGRRALLTMQKGQTGIEAFNAAIREWNAAGDVSTSQ
ncbi:hypothetical protein J5277_18790 [Rhizobium sp. 16-449-1b]|uniref:hypothetical protein n=1 Tax=Rhizobium sp. 16-449-1b TaxID=2819989 RepID=UPI001ADC2CD1|nr:hypothetical protein [Rhizobium sp. 16-449-1b]MBO9196154.1 hypothetical protein [Rhizobium sp. 16-449-1b]